MIKAVYKLTNPSDALGSLTITMTLGEWERLRAQLSKNGDYPGWRIATMIGDMLDRAHEQFTGAAESMEP